MLIPAKSNDLIYLKFKNHVFLQQTPIDIFLYPSLQRKLMIYSRYLVDQLIL